MEFSDAQWRALRKVFPDGSCDWRRRGADQAGARAWQTHQRLDGSLVYPGRRLGPAPGGSGRLRRRLDQRLLRRLAQRQVTQKSAEASA